MNASSVPTAIAFIVLVLVMWFLVSNALRRAFAKPLVSLAVTLAYIAVPAILARAGALDRFDPPPAPALVMIGVLTVITLAFTLSPAGARLASSVGIVGLVGFQAFRVPVELLLHRLYVEGAIPVQMTYAGRNFDIVSGLTAIVVAAWLLRRRTPSKRVVLAWNVLGLLLLANIVAVAALSTPVAFRQFTEGPPNLLPAVFPYVWLPSFLVQLALAGHILVFRWLRGLPPSR